MYIYIYIYIYIIYIPGRKCVLPPPLFFEPFREDLRITGTLTGGMRPSRFRW